MSVAEIWFLRPAAGEHRPKSPAEFSPADWAPIVDARWANVLDDAQKLRLFDNWWNNLDSRYGGHHNSDVNLDTLQAKYRPEVEAGNLSRGRFARNHDPLDLSTGGASHLLV